MISFVVDEERIRTPLANICSEFLGLSETISELKKFDFCKSYVTAAAWQTQIFDDVELYEVLFTRGHLDDDIRAVIMRQFEELFSLDLAQGMSTRDYVVSEIKNARPAASIVIPSEAGPVHHQDTLLHQIGSSPHVMPFLREAADIGKLSEARFMEYAISIFPRLVFQKDLAAQIRTLPNSFQAGLRRTLIDALAALNDVLPRLLDEGVEQTVLGQAFQSECGFEISIESKNTRRSERLMSKRDATLGTQTLRCEWHLKLEPTRGRIHFYFGPELTGKHKDKVFIGIFCNHL